MQIFIIAAGAGRGRILCEWVGWSLWQCCRLVPDLILYPQLMMISYLKPRLMGCFFCRKSLRKTIGTCASSRAYKYLFFFLMSCESNMESRCVNGIFTSQILIQVSYLQSLPPGAVQEFCDVQKKGFTWKKTSAVRTCICLFLIASWLVQCLNSFKSINFPKLLW